MPYSSLTNRSDIGPLIPEDVTKQIIKGVTHGSAVLALARRVPNMTRAQQRMPVLSALPTAYWVTGDTGMKQTTEMAWGNKYLDVEELAVIVPIPENVIDDTDYDLWGEIQPSIVEAIGIAVDQAILYGSNAPASWPDDLLTGATAAGNTVVLGTNADLYDDLLSETGTLAALETDGFMHTGHVAAMIMKARLRGLRDANGQPLFLSRMQETTQYELDGTPLIFPLNGAILPASALLFSGQWDQLIFSIRKDITWKMLTEAVITDNASPPNIVYNLPQQDMVAMRVTFRMAWQLPNPINRLQPVEANRYPFAALLP